ncbi:MAG: VWA domain-containing protein [Fibrobacteria bacterium]
MTVSAFFASAYLPVQSAQICNLVFAKCPSNFATATINVPKDVIWLDPVIPVCSENVQVVTGSKPTSPSIMFIIDNSGSMSTGEVDDSNRGNDPDEARFRVVKALLDTIAMSAPTAEVGMAIFTRRLQFDHRDNPFFKTAFPADTSQHDSYVPLTTLNQDFGNGAKGVDTLKALLSYTGNGNLVYATKLPASRPSSLAATNLRDGTDISLGFEAAKEAMKAAKAAPADQYFIFLSDGEPSTVDISRDAFRNDFIKGVGAATTFTIFFKNSPNPTAPQTIIDMTEAIKINGYSTSNSKSAHFAINLPGSQLLTLLQNSILNPILANTPGKPVTAVMEVGGTRYNSASVNTQNFTFPQRVPIGATQTTVNLTYTYQYTDSGKTKTKDVPYVLTLNRTNGSAPLVDGLTMACQEQGTISLFNKGNPVNIVTADHNDLDIHLTLANGETCNGCKVEVKPSKSADRENVKLDPGSGYQTGNFGRETNATAVPGDNKLQHLPTDSIIVTYVNPDNPLDVIRKAFPYSDVSTVLNVIRHNDYSRAGDLVPPVTGQQFVLVTSGAVTASPTQGAKNWSMLPALLTAKDSLRYVGNVIQASRAFKCEIQIFTNLGQFVNKIDFTIPQTEFAKLAKSPKGNTRQLRVLWDNRTSSGNLAGTGAYVLKTTVTLLRIPGIAEDEAVSTDYRVVGVLRDQ